jgi:hypothetical protein
MFKNRLDNSIDQNAKLRPVISSNGLTRNDIIVNVKPFVSKHCQHMFAWNKSVGRSVLS